MIDLPQNTWQVLFDKRWKAELKAAPEPLQQWLPDEGSLTERLGEHYTRPINVQLLHQTLCFANAAAAETLLVEEGSALLHREVLLCNGDVPVIFACSLLPEIALTGRYDELRQLDERPLGHWIFAEPALKRASMRFGSLACDNPLFVRLEHLASTPPELWGRVSLFEGATTPLLVSEFFLPSLLN